MVEGKFIRCVFTEKVLGVVAKRRAFGCGCVFIAKGLGVWAKRCAGFRMRVCSYNGKDVRAFGCGCVFIAKKRAHSKEACLQQRCWVW